MATRGERPTKPSRQFGEAFVLGGLGALVGTPVVYRIRAASSHAHMARSWLWPTWWMLVPLVVTVVGLLVVYAPAWFDVRRSLLRMRPASRRRGS